MDRNCSKANRLLGKLLKSIKTDGFDAYFGAYPYLRISVQHIMEAKIKTYLSSRKVPKKFIYCPVWQTNAINIIKQRRGFKLWIDP
jgi:hypothetical protein